MGLALELKASDRLLDAGCGAGRHTIEFAARGFQTTGVDLSDYYLGIARRNAIAKGVSPTFCQADLRAMPFEHEFDAAVSLYTSFGYLDSDAGNQTMLMGIRRSLNHGGRFLIDVLNRDFMAMHETISYGGSLRWWLTDCHRSILYDFLFDVTTSHVTVTTLLLEGGQRKSAEHKIRLYAYHELRRMLEAAGFALRAAYGNYDGESFTPNARRLILVASAE